MSFSKINLATLLVATGMMQAVVPANAAIVPLSYSVGGHNISGNITTLPNLVIVTIHNQDVPANISDVVTALNFWLSGGFSATLSSAIGALININVSGGYAPTGSINLDWQQLGPGNYTTALVGGPDNGLIGPFCSNFTYSCADGTIRADVNNNPFAFVTGVFTFNALGVTANTTPVYTEVGLGLTPIMVGVQGTAPVPEPTTMALVGGALALAGLLRRKQQA